MLSASTRPLCPSLSKGDVGMDAVCPRGVPILPHVPHKAEQGCWCCSYLCAGKVSSFLCSEKVVTAPSPVPVAPFLPSCGALIDAMAPSTRPTNKHLYPLLFVPTPPAHRAAGKRASFWCQNLSYSTHASRFWSCLVPTSSPINLPPPWLPSSLDHILGRIHRSQKCPTKHLELRLDCVPQHLLQVAG